MRASVHACVSVCVCVVCVCVSVRAYACVCMHARVCTYEGLYPERCISVHSNLEYGTTLSGI